MEFSLLLPTTLAVTLVCMFLLWLLSLPLRNVSIVDIFWGPGFAVIAVVCLLLAEGYTPRQWLLTALPTIWGLRLGIYLAIRNIGHGEDPRYASMRQRVDAKGGNFAISSLLLVFVLQGVVMWIVSLPVQAGQAASTPASLGWLAALGTLVWLVGLCFEAIGDAQLRRFKADPANKGEVMDRGLWRYTRHPNYFGNACLWWGIWLVALETGTAWWTVIGPVLMTFFLLRVSGVALLERSLQDSKPKYRDYVRRTSAFFPLPPRKE
jgi:steroid 5-alpha reductase family enzyme